MQAFIDNYPVLFSIFLLGFASSGHCVAMCGGLLSVLNLKTQHFELKQNIIFHCGRLFAYALLGFVFGASMQIISSTLLAELAFILRLCSALIMLVMALYLFGLSNLLRRLDRFAHPLWEKIYPLLQNLLPMDSAAKAFIFGSLWIFLPCGLVYSALALAITTASAFWSALAMFVFGLATVPALLATGGLFSQINSAVSFRYFSAFMLLVLAFWVLAATLGIFHGDSAHHFHFAQ